MVRRRIDLETMLCVYTEVLKTQGQISKKTSVLKSIVRVITHVIFQLCRVYPAGVIWKNKNWRQIFKQTKSTFEQIFFEKRTYSTYVITVWFSEYLKKSRILLFHRLLSLFAGPHMLFSSSKEYFTSAPLKYWPTNTIFKKLWGNKSLLMASLQNYRK